MSKTTIKNFFDEEYEYQILNCIVGSSKVKKEEKNGKIIEIRSRDARYGESIMGLLGEEYFSTVFLKKIVKIIKSHYGKYRTVPTYREIKAHVQLEVKSSIEKEQIIDELIRIANVKIEDRRFVEDAHKRFFTQQAILDFCYNTIDGIKKGKDIQNVDSMMASLRDFQRKMYHDDRPLEIIPDQQYNFDDKAEKIELGWGEYFDQEFNFKQGRLALGIVPTGVGKTTSAVVTAVHNFLQGKKVLMVFFEDYYEDLVKKIYAKLSGVGISTVVDNVDTSFKIINPKIKDGYDNGGRLVLIKKNQTTTTTNDLRLVIDNFIAQHGQLDLLVLDYLDCLKSPLDKNYKDEYAEQADVIIDVITLVSDLEYFIPCLTYIQSGRAGINKAIVGMEEGGGSVKRAFKAHQVFTISKTVTQKSNFKATIKIDKNREGNAGVIFKDVVFDNSKVTIEIDETNIETMEAFMS